MRVPGRSSPATVTSSNDTSTFAVVESTTVVNAIPAMFPGVERTVDGLIVTFSTVPDGMPGGQIATVHSVDNGRTWSDPTVIVEPLGEDDAAITQVGIKRLVSGRLILPFNRVTIRGGYANRVATLHMATSDDDGHHWDLGEPVRLEFHEPLTYGTIVETASGRLVAPIWGRQRPDERWRSAVVTSDDGGATWDPEPRVVAFDATARLFGTYTQPDHNAVDEHGEPAFGNITNPAFRPHAAVDGFCETSITATLGGLIAMLRQQGVAGEERLRFYRSESHDDGRTWSDPTPIDLDGMSPLLYPLGDGTLALGYRRCAPDGSESHPGTAIAVSTDRGHTWNDVVDVVDPNGYAWTHEYQTGYPDLVTLDDDTMLCVFYSLDPTRGNQRYVVANRLRRSGV